MNNILPPAKALILLVLEKQPGIDRQDLMAATGRGKSTVNRALADMVGLDWLRYEGNLNRHYWLTERGEAMLPEAREVKQPRPRESYLRREGRVVEPLEAFCPQLGRFLRSTWA